MWELIVEALTSDLLPILQPSDDLDAELLEDYPELIALGIDI